MLSNIKRDQIIIFIIFFLVFISILLRFYRLNAPPYDTHNSRQTQTLATIEDFHQNGIDLLYPKTHYVGYPGYQLLEFPFYQAVVSKLWKAFPATAATVRIYNILIHIFTAFLLILILKKYFAMDLCLLTAAVFILTPLNLMYSRSMLLDPTAVFFNMVVILLFLEIEKINNIKSIFLLIIWSICVILAALIKPLYLFPFCIIFFLKIFKRDKITIALYGISLSIALVLLFMWVKHADTVNAAHYFTSMQAVENHLGFKAIFTPTFWFKMVQRFNLKIAPGPSLLFLLFSLYIIFFKKDESNAVSIAKISWLCVVSFLVIFANINSPHDYYQLILIPFLSFIVIFSLNYFCDNMVNKDLKYPVILMFILSLFLASNLTYFTYARISVQVLEFQAKVKPHLDKTNEYVITFINTSYFDRFKNFPKSKFYKGPDFENVAALYSIGKWGTATADINMEESLNYLKNVPGDLIKQFGEIIYYRYNKNSITEEQLGIINQLGYQEKYRDDDVLIFRRKT
ncbi:MAG: phospholipid carrier-dependent glycosyltransferase [bacterium]